MDKQYGKVTEYKVKDYKTTVKEYKPKITEPKSSEYKLRNPPKLEVDNNKPVKVLPTQPINTKYKQYVPAWSKGPMEAVARLIKRKPKKPKKEVVIPGFSSVGSVKRTLYMFTGPSDETE